MTQFLAQLSDDAKQKAGSAQLHVTLAQQFNGVVGYKGGAENREQKDDRTLKEIPKLEWRFTVDDFQNFSK